jgi:hypothetical protein
MSQMSNIDIDIAMLEQMLEQNPENIDWSALSLNPNAFPLLAKNLNKIDWRNLSANTNPDAISLLENNMDKIYWKVVIQNPSISEYLKGYADRVLNYRA